MAAEYIERLWANHDEERWLVQDAASDQPHVRWIFTNEDPYFLESVRDETAKWFGPIHPRLSTIYRGGFIGARLVFDVEDDRGPQFIQAAKQLTEPIDRERWCVAQIVALGDALAAMRQRDARFVHRHLDPVRIFIDVAGHARLRAPIARVEAGERRSIMGRTTAIRPFPRYISPEIARGKVATPASDVFSLAGVLYTALSGRRPFDEDSDFDLLMAIVDRDPPPITTYAPNLAAVLRRAFAKNPKERYPDPGTFAGELWRCVPDATDYDEVVSDRIVMWRATRERGLEEDGPSRSSSEGQCRMAWDSLKPKPADPDVRHCSSCGQDVVRVKNVAVLPLVGQRCIYVPGTPAVEDDGPSTKVVVDDELLRGE